MTATTTPQRWRRWTIKIFSAKFSDRGGDISIIRRQIECNYGSISFYIFT